MDIMELVKGCRTYRRFLQEPVSDEILNDMIEAARITNSGMNAQIMRYVVISNPEVVRKINSVIKLGGMVPELGLPREGEGPTAFIALYVDGEPNFIKDVDTGIAVHTITTVAYASGVASCIMASFPKDKIAEIIGLDGHEIRLMLALGKPAHKSTIVEPGEDGSLKYYVDDNADFYVPKRPASEIAKFIK